MTCTWRPAVATRDVPRPATASASALARFILVLVSQRAHSWPPARSPVLLSIYIV